MTSTLDVAPSAPTAVLSVSPIVLKTPGRAVDLQLRVSAPVTGIALPIILLSHGQGPSNNLSSMNGYAPLASAWAAAGCVVIQPTHLSSRTLQLDPNGSGAPLYWRSRAQDMSLVIGRLDEIEVAVPQLAGRLDRSRICVVGHSMGGHTASLLLGARLTDPDSGRAVNLADTRIVAGVLLAAPGRGGEALSASAAAHYPFFSTTDFSTMTTPALVVAGDQDDSPHLTVAGPAWHADAYALAPGPKTLLMVFGAGHGLGGVSGYDVAETTDENPDRVADVARLSAAYLRNRLYPADPAWQQERDALNEAAYPIGRVEEK